MGKQGADAVSAGGPRVSNEGSGESTEPGLDRERCTAEVDREETHKHM